MIFLKKVEVLGGNQLRFRSEEHTSELQSRRNLVCRLLLEKKNGLESLHFTLSPHLIYFTLYHYLASYSPHASSIYTLAWYI